MCSHRRERKRDILEPRTYALATYRCKSALVLRRGKHRTKKKKEDLLTLLCPLPSPPPQVDSENRANCKETQAPSTGAVACPLAESNPHSTVAEPSKRGWHHDARGFVSLSCLVYAAMITRMELVDPAVASFIPWMHTTLSPGLTQPFCLPMSIARKTIESVPIMEPITCDQNTTQHEHTRKTVMNA